MNITTNNQPRDLLCAWEIPAAVLASEFDYIENPEESGARFFQYRGWWYDINEFMRCDFAPAHTEMDPLRAWDGYASDSYFSGVLVRYTDDCERVIVATYVT